MSIKSSNFLIILGGPGKFWGCDKAHDQNWSNYLVPIQLAARRKLFNLGINEKVHLLPYEPAYKNRWVDDSVITKLERSQIDGYWLHSNRKAKADKVKQKRANNYLHRIQQIAKTHGMHYKGLQRPADFWSYVRTLSDGSISRVWYSGHASGNGLMLSLTHSDQDGEKCVPSAYYDDMIWVDDISKHRALSSKFSSSHDKVSKFLGCYTYEFAKTWNRIFNVKTEGAELKVDFGSLDRQSSISNIIERIEKTPTTHGNPRWTKFYTVKKPHE